MPSHYANPDFNKHAQAFAERMNLTVCEKALTGRGRCSAIEQFERWLRPICWTNYIRPGFVVDLHGHYPDEELDEQIDITLRKAQEAGLERLTFIHGHGLFRNGRPRFWNSNTGVLGLAVRAHLAVMKEYIYVSKIDKSHSGSTTVYIRSPGKPKKRR